MARFILVESLEPRMFLSAGPLAQAKAALSLAVDTLETDKSTAAMVIAADNAKVAADKKGNDPNLVPLRATLQQDQVARTTTLATDRSNLKIAIGNDNSIILSLRNDIHIDIVQKNAAQLAIDKAQLAKDVVTLQRDRNTLNVALQNDIVTTAAAISKDQKAIASEIRNHGKTTLAADKRTLAHDQRMWASTLAADRKAVSRARLAVAVAKLG